MKRGARDAFTLAEIVAVVAVAGVVGGLVAATVSRQQRMHRAASETLDVRRSVRDAVVVLAEEIRSASAADTIRLMADSAIELFTGFGASVACRSLDASSVGLAPTSLAGTGLTSWLSPPDTGDLALVYRTASSTAGVWERHRIRAVSSRPADGACPADTGLSGGPGASVSGYVLTLHPSPGAIAAGAPVRFIRRGRYSLYRSSDGKWYLGYRRCNALGASSCGVIQPLSGHYQAYSADSARTGILFRFFDSGNRALSPGSDPTRVARVQIVARARSSIPVTMNGAARNASDSASASAALRNHP